MKKIILLILSLPIVASACNGYVIGFKGINDIFDESAFKDYAKQMDYCSKSYSWNKIDSAVKFIDSLNTPYQLYGYSQGAWSVAKLLKKEHVAKPEYIITIGAYRTTDVNFDKYGIPYENYFDHSGKGQLSPGVFLNVPHSMIQREVTRIKSTNK